VGVAEERLGHGFDHARFAGAGRPEEKQITDGAAGSVKSRQEHLVDFGYFFDGLVLTDDTAAEGSFKLSSIAATAVGIEHGGEIRSHNFDLFPGRMVRPFATRLDQALLPRG
jgi:hypothetical protein